MSNWKQWVNLILGILVVIFAFIGGEHLYRYAIVGVLIAIVALWAALEKKT